MYNGFEEFDEIILSIVKLLLVELFSCVSSVNSFGSYILGIIVVYTSQSLQS